VGRPAFSDLPSFVKSHSSERAGRDAFNFLPDLTGRQAAQPLTYASLDQQARAVAGWLVDRQLTGERVVLMFPSGLSFVSAFLGCLYAGAVAVPGPPPDGYRAQTERITGLMRDSAASGLLTTAADLPSVREWLSAQQVPGLHCAAVDDLIDGDAGIPLPAVKPDDLAFIQYTSGSTAAPKGVMVTHGNLLANVRAISAVVGTDPDFRAIGWLPLIHDMGLVGLVCQTLYAGASCLLTPPLEFIKRPHRWLELIGEHQIQGTAAPNFAFDLCVRAVQDAQVETMDLSSLRVAINGAEPIRAGTLDAFGKKFAPAGFARSAFVCSYGLAESTLLVSGTPAAAEPTVLRVSTRSLAAGRISPAQDGDEAKDLVSSGPPIQSEIRIADPKTGAPLDTGQIGEIWVRSSSIAAGYWDKATETADVFNAVTTTGEHGFLRTGDLGALCDGELFVTGRLKDVIVVSGHNLYPSDVEASLAELDPRLRATAAFSLLPDSADIVVVQEVRPQGATDADLGALAETIRRHVSSVFDVASPSVVLVKPGSISKTTSGKVRRSLMRDRLLEGQLPYLHRVLTTAAQQVIGTEQLEVLP
jgi:acyl-CoA synthetase (AMP-forming)/AMP-acid ligase II